VSVPLVGIGAKLTGPSIAISFFLCGVAYCSTSLASAEYAARVPLELWGIVCLVGWDGI
jgi:hypothetical protein